MMKLVHINRSGMSLLAVLFVGIFASLFHSSCDNTDECIAPSIDSITFRDSLVSIDYLVPGRVITIHGENLDETSSLIINSTTLSASYMLVYEQSITFLVPYISTNDENTEFSDSLRIIKDCGEDLYMVNILNAPPYITKISNEYAIPGDTIRLEGRYFALLESVTFPGDIEGELLDGYTDTTCDVVVPSNVLNSGAIELVSKSGTSNSRFGIVYRDRSGLICNFDDKNTWDGTGGELISPSTNSSLPPANGYYFLSEAQNISPGSGDIESTKMALEIDRSLSYSGNLTPEYFAIKLEALLLHPWTSGAYHLEIGYEAAPGDVEFAYEYDFKPWESDTVIDWSSAWPRWNTVSIPLSDFKLVGSENTYLQSYSQLRIINYMKWNFINPESEADGGGSTINAFGVVLDNIRIKQVVEEDE
ncbi:MAG: hypothetical protein JW801_15830 [Bacteroidales bacterium]|nr:hypothetical protein [Bacteroidales bacterium]